MGFVPRAAARRPRPVGRPRDPIPAELTRILEETFATGQAYAEDVTGMGDDDLHKLRRMGERYADHSGLSFRWRLIDESDDRRTVTFWLQTKNKYNRPKAPKVAA
jgi:hypothetical protein